MDDLRSAPHTLSNSRPSDELTRDELRLAYQVGCRSRALEQWIVRLVNQGRVRFAIWGSGEEAHGTATALAWKHLLGGPERFGFGAHYRSGPAISMWYELNGHGGFSLDILRQQLSKSTDWMSEGRNMVYHVVNPELGILPVQSPVGMQLGKAAGYAKGFQTRRVEGAVVFTSLGDGSTAEGDLHEAMNAASVWRLPLVVMVTDNNIAISTSPEQGRGIKDFQAYAEAFDMGFLSCDGKDFFACYDTAHEATTRAMAGEPMLWHVQDLPRPNGHSSAGNYRYDLHAPDPLMDLGLELVRREVLSPEEIYTRKEGSGADFFNHHELGSILGAAYTELGEQLSSVEEEAEPSASGLLRHIRPPMAEHPEPAQGQQEQPGTSITYAGALRAAHARVLEQGPSLLLGQDVGELGGVMQATAGLKQAFPEQVMDAPLNEPLIVGTAAGAGLHEGTTAIAEIQFGDYSLNTYHWLVHLGNLYWQTVGLSKASVIVRMPTDPFGGGAIYHSMSVDGFFSAIPGLVMVMPSTSLDAYGLLISAAEYGGPVVFLEPKWCYRRALGPRLPGEPTDSEAIGAMKAAVMRGAIPNVDPFHVELGKAILRRQGSHLTIVAWGRAVHRALASASRLAQQGIEAEVIDLRTLVPPDMSTVLASVERTGRLLVASEDRVFAGLGREIQGAVVSKHPGMPTAVVGMMPIPGIPQNHGLEQVAALTEQQIEDAASTLLATKVAGSLGPRLAWLPAPYMIG